MVQNLEKNIKQLYALGHIRPAKLRIKLNAISKCKLKNLLSSPIKSR
ncbi:hypothetical protein T01_12720 [Trichinella spiralis]|uniref:Uncharacterized protein n=1 Tax=Trichinella spiralis TaxID=6334 RepID=A0A0V0Z3I4_TRISP|nr:hypothetical protein T01_12720 [Trichinella spiralis]